MLSCEGKSVSTCSLRKPLSPCIPTIRAIGIKLIVPLIGDDLDEGFFARFGGYGADNASDSRYNATALAADLADVFRRASDEKCARPALLLFVDLDRLGVPNHRFDNFFNKRAIAHILG